MKKVKTTRFDVSGICGDRLSISRFREAFSASRREQLRVQGPITIKVIRKLEKSRKYALSPASAAKRG